MIREELRKIILHTVQKKYGTFELPNFSVEVPENPKHGDYSSNIALRIGGQIKKNPMEVAEGLLEDLKKNTLFFSRVAIVNPGFINCWISSEIFQTEVGKILKEGKQYGNRVQAQAKRARVEYVSANPTGPLHIGNARGGPWGETISRVLEKSGYRVLREYIHNDAGTQVEKMGETLWYWYQKELGNEIPFPEGGYPGEYLREVAVVALASLGRELKKEADRMRLTKFGLDYIYRENMAILERMRIRFDYVVKESELLAFGKTQAAVRDIERKGYAKERDGALWFTPQDEFLQDREAVMIRSTGQPTYFASDIAYHKEKFESGYDLVIDVFGSNHHGHMPKLKALAKIFGFDPEHFLVLLYQYVRVRRGSEIIKMSKRAGTYVTAKEVLEEAGPDAMIFFLLLNAANSHMDFDLKLAAEQSQKNPVYYVQYAHARCVSILNKAQELGLKFSEPTADILQRLLEPEDVSLMKKIVRLPEIVEDTLCDYQVQRLPHYALDLARVFHTFYEKERVICEDQDVTQARLALVAGVRIVLENTLYLIAVEAPNQM